MKIMPLSVIKKFETLVKHLFEEALARCRDYKSYSKYLLWVQ